MAAIAYHENAISLVYVPHAFFDILREYQNYDIYMIIKGSGNPFHEMVM